MNRALGHLRLADLQLLISAAKFNNLTKAAKQHHLSQSAASAAIKRVEIAFEKKLCTHEKRQFELSQEGSILIEKSEKWIAQFYSDVVEISPNKIRIATTHAISKIIVNNNLICNNSVELKLMRPDIAYNNLIQNKIDLIFVINNYPWSDVNSIEINHGLFQLYSRKNIKNPTNILLPEDQIEVLDLKQKWKEKYDYSIPIQTCIPSWSLISEICSNSDSVGFLPDFLTINTSLKPVSWQPEPSPYKLLALYNKNNNSNNRNKIIDIINHCKKFFT